MHELQPKYSKLKPEEVKKLTDKFNISVSQLPKIKSDDAGIKEDFQKGDVIKIERKLGDKTNEYFRVIA